MADNRSFWDEIKERRVVRVGLIYLAVGWAVLEGSDLLTDILALPDVTPRLVLALLALGFPVALVLAWAFQLTAAGVERARPYAAERGGSKTPLIATGVVAAITFGAAGFLLRGQLEEVPPGASVNPNLVAILPFSVSGSADIEWIGDGVMTLLAHRFDGEIGPRAVESSVVAGVAADGSLPAQNVAITVGAGVFVTGSVVGSGTQATFSAELHSSDGQSDPIPAEISAHPDSLALIADRLYAQLLSLSAGEDERSVADLTSRSPEALREYLLGRTAWRAAQYFDAVRHLDRALEVDSTFALAAIARADASNMTTGLGEGGALELAARHADRLSQRDLDYLEARRPPRELTLSEAADAWRALAREQPDRLEAWYWLGETLIHWRGDMNPRWADEVRSAFEEVLELDPNHLVAKDHLIFLAAEHGTLEELRTLAADAPHAYYWFRDILAGGDRLVFDPESHRATEDPNSIVLGPVYPPLWVEHLPESLGEYPSVAIDLALREAGVGDTPLEATLNAAWEGAIAHGYHGWAAEIWDRSVRDGVQPRYGSQLVRLATWDGFSHPDTEESVRFIEASRPNASDLTYEVSIDLFSAEAWRFETDSDYRSRELADYFLAAAEAAEHPRSTQYRMYGLNLRAWASAREGGAEAATRDLEEIDRIVRMGVEGGRGAASLLPISAVWEELGVYDRALEILERRPYFSSGAAVHLVAIWRRSGRLAVQLGDTERARQEYGRYLKIRFDPDPELQAEVAEVRAALEALGN